jgi:thiosulfate dehydrogenase
MARAARRTAAGLLGLCAWGLCVSGVAACTTETGSSSVARVEERVEIPAAELGARLFADPNLSPSELNTWSCATCHAMTDDDTTRILPGYPLHNVTTRPRTWGGNQRSLLDAVNFCLVYFMRGDPLTATSDASKALYEHLAQGRTPQATRPFTAVKNIVDVPRGDAVRGAEVYQKACFTCHGEKGTGVGANINPALLVVLPNVKEEYPEVFPGVDPALVFIEKTRHGQFFGVGGNMPLFSLEALSNADLGALLAYLEL